MLEKSNIIVYKNRIHFYKLKSYTKACGSASSWESFVPLADRYKRFKQTHMNKMVLNEIKKNLIDNV